MKKEKPEWRTCIKRRVRNRDSNGKLIHRARSSYFSALGVVMNIKPARVNPNDDDDDDDADIGDEE